MKTLESLLEVLILWVARDPLSPFKLFIPAFLLMAIAILFRSQHEATTTYEFTEVTHTWYGSVFEDHPNLDKLMWVASILLWLLSLLAQLIQVASSSGSSFLLAAQFFGYIGAATIFLLVGSISMFIGLLVGVAVLAGLYFSIMSMGWFNPIIFGFVGFLAWILWASQRNVRLWLSFLVFVGGSEGLWFFLKYL